MPAPPRACVRRSRPRARRPTARSARLGHALRCPRTVPTAARRVAAGPAPTPTPAVAWADQRLRATGGNIRIGTLAAELGCTRRYLTSRFSAEVGLAPKAVARQLRFARVRERLQRDPAGIAEIAAAAGYYDQAHLYRDFRELAGVTPTEFVARLIPGGGVLGDGL